MSEREIQGETGRDRERPRETERPREGERLRSSRMVLGDGELHHGLLESTRSLILVI